MTNTIAHDPRAPYRIIAKHTGRTLDEVLEKTARDTYFEAEEAVAWGLADRIIETI